MRNKICLWIRRFRMNKFYHGELCNIACKASGVGWHRIPLLRRFPYLTGRDIHIRLSLKSVYGNEEWQQGVLRYEPPLFSANSYLFETDKLVREAEKTYGDVFLFEEWQRVSLDVETPKYKFQKGKSWSGVISVKSGEVFNTPRAFQCYLRLENINHNSDDTISSIETGEIRIADIEIMSETTFFMWLITTTIAIVALILGLT